MKYLMDFSLLKRNRDYRYLYIGQFVSFIGTMLSSVAMPYQVYQMTHSTIMVGLLSFVQLMPLLITALIGGVIADRRDRKWLLISSEILLTMGGLGLAWNAMFSHASLLIIFGIACLMSAINGIHRPAFEGISQQLVQEKDYKALGALVSFKYSFCSIVGPAIAGLLIAHSGIVFTYLIDCFSFFVSVFCLCRIHEIPKPMAKTHLSVWQALKEGMHFAYKRQTLMGSYLVDFFAMIFAMPNALFPAIATSLGGAKVLGLLYAAPAVGALLLSFFSQWTTRITQDGKAIAISAALWGGAIIGFGLSNKIGWAIFFLILSGAFDAASGIFRLALWNNIIPMEFRGRLAGIEMLSYLCGPKLGDTRAGFLAASFGITSAIVSGGVMSVIAVTVCCLCFPQFWSYSAKGK